MKTLMAAVLVAVATLVAPATAGEQWTRVFPAPADRVWAATLSALTTQGWGVDGGADRTIGTITTKSHRLQGDDLHVGWGNSVRFRLRISVIPVDDALTRVTVEREVFRRTRTLWEDRDERVNVTDPARPGGELERVLFSAIARAL